MKFIFDCDNEICLPAMYKFVDDVKPFIDKVKSVEVDDSAEKLSSKEKIKLILENVMVKFPTETGKLLDKLWVLESEDEKAPNVFKTMAALFSSEAAIDFFTSALPSLLSLSNNIFRLSK